MKPGLLVVFLVVSTLLAGGTLVATTPKRLVIGWLGIGLSQSLFLLVIGFELLALLNLLFVVASATVLQLYSALFGTAATHDAEKTRERRDWIYGIGAGGTIGAILVFALVSVFPESETGADLTAPDFATEILASFPELPWVLGVTLFLAIVTWATVGRPGWKRDAGGGS